MGSNYDFGHDAAEETAVLGVAVRALVSRIRAFYEKELAVALCGDVTRLDELAAERRRCAAWAAELCAIQETSADAALRDFIREQAEALMGMARRSHEAVSRLRGRVLDGFDALRRLRCAAESAGRPQAHPGILVDREG